MARRSGPRAGTIITIVALLALLLGGSGLLLAPHGAAEPSHAATPPPPGPAELSVAVLGVGGTPLPGVAVRAWETQGSGSVEGTTDGAGSVRFDSLPAAELSVILPGSRFARTWPVTLVPGPNQLRIDLTEHAELTGRVSGLPQGEDGWDACLSNDDLERTCVPIDETGRYAFTGIDVPEAGRYRLEVARWFGEGGVRAATLVTLGAGQRVTRDLDLAQTRAVVSGRVIAQDGSPAAGVVRVLDAEADETVASSPIEDGQYRVVVDPAGPVLRLVVLSPAEEVLYDEPLTVAGGDDITLDITLGPGGDPAAGSVTGTVTDERGEPVLDAHVWVCRGYRCVTVTTAADGTYRVDRLSAGAVTARASSPVHATSQTWSGTLPAGGSLTADLTIQRLLPLPGGIIVGGTQPTDPPGRFPAVPRGTGAPISMTACTGGQVRFTVDTDGAGPVLTGRLIESSTTPGAFAGRLPPAPSGAHWARVTVTVTCPDGTSQETPFDIVYIDPSGTVLDTSGTPVEGARVVLERSETQDGPFEPLPQGSELMSPDNRVNPWTTDASGAFRWDVAQGYYRLRVSAPGHHVPGTDEEILTTQVWRIPPEVTGLELVLEKDEAEPEPERVAPTISLRATPSRVNVGRRVTLQTRVDGSSARPTGTIDITRDGSPVRGCQNIPLRRGRARCVTTAAEAGTLTYRAEYSGDERYLAAEQERTVRAVKARQSVRVNGPWLTRAGRSVDYTIGGRGPRHTVVVAEKTPGVCTATVTERSVRVRTSRPGLCLFTVARHETDRWAPAAPRLVALWVAGNRWHPYGDRSGQLRDRRA